MKNDWRIRNQKEYLKGVTLQFRKYTKEDHDHCEFCWAKFLNEEEEDVLTSGYCTEDEYRWICPNCFDDFKLIFAWKVKE